MSIYRYAILLLLGCIFLWFLLGHSETIDESTKADKPLSTTNDTNDSNNLLSFTDYEIDSAAFIATTISIGDIGINIATGRVTIPEDMALDDASKNFWDAIEKHFKNNVKLALRLQLWQEMHREMAEIVYSAQKENK